MDRAQFGTISNNLVLPATLQRYRDSFDLFKLFVRGLAPRRADDGTFDYIDFALVQYLEHLWQEGEGISVANYSLAELVHFVPAIRAHLHCSRRILKGWQKLELPARACPLSLDMILAMCGVLVL